MVNNSSSLYKELPYSIAKGLIKEADVVMVKGSGIFSPFLRHFQQSPYTHCGLATQYNGPDSLWEMVEFKEFKGGRTVNLETQVNKHSGNIDIYRPISPQILISLDTNLNVNEEVVVLNGKKVTRLMRALTGLPYGWRRILWLVKFHLFGIRLLYSGENFMDDTPIADDLYPVCSSAVAAAFSMGFVDLIKNRSDQRTEPADIAMSARLQYLFTIVADSPKVA